MGRGVPPTAPPWAPHPLKHNSAPHSLVTAIAVVWCTGLICSSSVWPYTYLSAALWPMRTTTPVVSWYFTTGLRGLQASRQPQRHMNHHYFSRCALQSGPLPVLLGSGSGRRVGYVWGRTPTPSPPTSPFTQLALQGTKAPKNCSRVGDQ